MTLHIVGAGIAGLAAAVSATLRGSRVVVYEAAPHAGGRCRSFVDRELGVEIDNGNHLLLSANTATLSYVEAIGARDQLLEIAPARFPFVDAATGLRWELRPNSGPLPWWLLHPGRRAPGTRVTDYLAACRLFAAGPERTVADCLAAPSAAYERVWKPLALAVMNAAPEAAAARPFAAVLRQTLLRGERLCRPLIARSGLSAALVDPALAWLRGRGASVRMGARLRSLALDGGRVTRLRFSSSEVDVAADDRVILALPPHAAADAGAPVAIPVACNPILNAHFRIDTDAAERRVPFVGIVGGTAEWIFVRPRVLSATVSNAGRLMDAPRDAVIERIWHDALRALQLPPLPIPRCKLVRERRATIALTPAAERMRPAAHTILSNLLLAGDWTATGLPPTIEGAVRSGCRAAGLAIDRAPA